MLLKIPQLKKKKKKSYCHSSTLKKKIIKIPQLWRRATVIPSLTDFKTPFILQLKSSEVLW